MQIWVTVILKKGSYYKFGQNLLQIRESITNWGITTILNLYSNSTNESLVTEFMAVKVSQNLNSMQTTSKQ